jgi:hypothetical protein
VSVTIPFLASGGIAATVLRPTSAIKPKANHGTGGVADLVGARCAESLALMLRANTMGANSMTRANLTVVAMSPARWPFWKDAMEANASRYRGKAPDELDWTDAQRQEARSG